MKQVEKTQTWYRPGNVDAVLGHSIIQEVVVEQDVTVNGERIPCGDMGKENCAISGCQLARFQGAPT